MHRRDYIKSESKASDASMPNRISFAKGHSLNPHASLKRSSQLAPESVTQSLAVPGRAMDELTRQKFESRFNHDFSQVRVHHDSISSHSANAVGASAYTVGEHIVFANQHYAPHSAKGQALLEHELTHVMQQRRHNMPLLQREPNPGTTNYRFDTYRITEADLSDPDMVARLDSLSLFPLIRYHEKVADVMVKDFIAARLNTQLRAMSFDSLFEELKHNKDPLVSDFIDRWLQDNAPSSYEIAIGATPGATALSMTESGMAISVEPDEFVNNTRFDAILAQAKTHEKHKNTPPSAVTLFTINVSRIRWDEADGKITRVKERPRLSMKIKTVYRDSVSRIGRSAYGVGTRKEDKKSGRRTLAHHEGTHAACHIQFVRNNPPPIFPQVNVGDSVNEISTNFTTYRDQTLLNYRNRMKDHCGSSVDCVGKKASFCP